MDWINHIFNMSGLITLVLVGTASYLSVAKGVADIPEYLKASLLTIVGFYFGGLAHQSRKIQSEENG
jgi:hypothetical protein